MLECKQTHSPLFIFSSTTAFLFLIYFSSPFCTYISLPIYVVFVWIGFACFVSWLRICNLDFLLLQEQHAVHITSYGLLLINNGIWMLHVKTYLIPIVSNHHPHAKNCCKHLLSLLDAKGLLQPRQSLILAGFMLSPPCPDPYRSEHLTQQQRPVATQHSAQLCWSSGSSFPHICNTTS